MAAFESWDWLKQENAKYPLKLSEMNLNWWVILKELDELPMQGHFY